MSDEIPSTDLLPLLFTTALVVYVLVMGNTDLARSVIRVSALISAAFCLGVWGAAALSFADWGGPVIEEFYATEVIARWLGTELAGWLLIVLAVVAVTLAWREMWRLKAAR